MIDERSIKTDRISGFDQALQNLLAQEKPNIFPESTKEYAKKEDRLYEFDLKRQEWWMSFEYYNDTENFVVTIGFPKSKLTIDKIKLFLEKYLGQYGEKYGYDASRDAVWIWFSKDQVQWDDFVEGQEINAQLVDEFAEEVLTLLDIAEKAEKQLQEKS